MLQMTTLEVMQLLYYFEKYMDFTNIPLEFGNIHMVQKKIFFLFSKGYHTGENNYLFLQS